MDKTNINIISSEPRQDTGNEADFYLNLVKMGAMTQEEANTYLKEANRFNVNNGYDRTEMPGVANLNLAEIRRKKNGSTNEITSSENQTVSEVAEIPGKPDNGLLPGIKLETAEDPSSSVVDNAPPTQVDGLSFDPNLAGGTSVAEHQPLLEEPVVKVIDGSAPVLASAPVKKEPPAPDLSPAPKIEETQNVIPSEKAGDTDNHLLRDAFQNTVEIPDDPTKLPDDLSVIAGANQQREATSTGVEIASGIEDKKPLPQNVEISAQSGADSGDGSGEVPVRVIAPAIETGTATVQPNEHITTPVKSTESGIQLPAEAGVSKEPQPANLNELQTNQSPVVEKINQMPAGQRRGVFGFLDRITGGGKASNTDNQAGFIDLNAGHKLITRQGGELTADLLGSHQDAVHNAREKAQQENLQKAA